MAIQRDIYKDIKPYFDSPEAIVITGMRRVGKTTLLRHIYEEISSTNKLFVDLENTLNQKYFEEEDYERIKINLQFLGISFKKKAFLFLDEIQFIKNLPSIVKYLGDHYEIKFFLTGSASFYLKNLFSESLAGRKYIFELFPLNFTEFLRLKEEKITIPSGSEEISQPVFQTLNRLYDEFLKFGGFPGVVAKEDFAEKKKAIADIFSSYFQLEVVGLGDFRKTSVVRDLMLLLMQRAGSRLDIQKLSSELGVSRPSIYEYLAFLEGTYFIHLIKPYSKSKDAEIRGSEKVYICDSGLLNNTMQVADGALFENNIFQLLRPRGKLNYYQKGKLKEIDFILNGEKAYEVKLHPSVRDITSLEKTSKEVGIRDFRLISKSYKNLKNLFYGFNI